MQIIWRESLLATPWKNGGGVTRQIASFPPGSDIGSFDWRLSTAEVAQDGPFSRFEGIDRRLYILDGAGLELRFADGTRHLRKGAHADFAGEAEVFGALVEGPVSDFNIMVRRERVRMRAEQITIEGPLTVDHRWGTVALFVLRGEIAVAGGAAGRFDTVLSEGAGSLRVGGAADVLLVGFEDLG